MSAETHNQIDINKDKGKDTSAIVTYLLEQLQEQLSDELDQVEASIKLLPLGKKTELVERIEGRLSDPLNAVVRASHGLNQRVLAILEAICEDFFANNAALIKEVYLIPNGSLRLDYYIVLNDDNEEVRDNFYYFLTEINSASLSRIYDAHFNFLLPEEVEKLPTHRQKVEFENG